MPCAGDPTKRGVEEALCWCPVGKEICNMRATDALGKALVLVMGYATVGCRLPGVCVSRTGLVGAKRWRFFADLYSCNLPRPTQDKRGGGVVVLRMYSEGRMYMCILRRKVTQCA